MEPKKSQLCNCDMKKQFFELKEGCFILITDVSKILIFLVFFSSQEVNVMKSLHSKFIASLVAVMRLIQASVLIHEKIVHSHTKGKINILQWLFCSNLFYFNIDVRLVQGRRVVKGIGGTYCFSNNNYLSSSHKSLIMTLIINQTMRGLISYWICFFQVVHT